MTEATKHHEESVPEKKKTTISSSLLKNKTPSYSSKDSKIVSHGLKMDDPKKRPLLISSTTKLSKPTTTTVKKPLLEKDSSTSLKMPIGLKRNNSPKTKTGEKDTHVGSALKNLPEKLAAKDKPPIKTPMSAQSGPKIGITASSASDKKSTTGFKASVLTKNKLGLNIKDLTAKPKMMDSKGDLASKLSSKYH